MPCVELQIVGQYAPVQLVMLEILSIGVPKMLMNALTIHVDRMHSALTHQVVISALVLEAVVEIQHEDASAKFQVPAQTLDADPMQFVSLTPAV